MHKYEIQMRQEIGEFFKRRHSGSGIGKAMNFKWVKEVIDSYREHIRIHRRWLAGDFNENK